MKRIINSLLIMILASLLFNESIAQKKDTLLTSSTLSGIKLRSIGPAFMSGRIADIAVHPDNNNIWYVAVGSGGVWKTVNSGTTWESIFDGSRIILNWLYNNRS